MVDRDGWTVSIFRVSRGVTGCRERRVCREQFRGLTRAVSRADRLVEELEEGALR